MPRLARGILPGYPYHITQRGNCWQDVEAHNRTRSPLANHRFLKEAKKVTGRDLFKKTPGAKSKEIN